jgi:L-aspartate oxidase
MKGPSALTCDLLVLGSGIAGLRGAIEAAEAGWNVFVATKDLPRESNTEYAQGGIAVALSEGDSPDQHFRDTLEAGDGLCREEAVRVLVEDGPERVLELIRWGARFDKEGERLHFTREAAHGRSRILHSSGDATGAELERALSARAGAQERIRMLPYADGIRLLRDDRGCCGAWLLDETENLPVPVFSRGVLIATGGVGRLFRESTNPPVATGDGIALALQAGMVLADLEFVQFHPTALFLEGAPRFLLSESMRGEGAVLRNADGQRFMDRYDTRAELAPRDVVTRAIIAEIRQTGGRPVTLDLTHLDRRFIQQRFPTIHRTCLEYGLDITRRAIPVFPAAHYVMGGIETDVDGRTSLPHAYAAGEVACTGVHGANRLASNSLLEGLVFGQRAARAALADAGPPPAVRPVEPLDRGHGLDLAVVNELRRRIAAVMWEGVGILRTAAGIEQARLALEGMCTLLRGGALHRRVLETCNMATVGDAVAACALRRTESRGAHYREDFPRTDPAWRVHTRMVKEGKGYRFLEEER